MKIFNLTAKEIASVHKYFVNDHENEIIFHKANPDYKHRFPEIYYDVVNDQILLSMNCATGRFMVTDNLTLS